MHLRPSSKQVSGGSMSLLRDGSRSYKPASCPAWALPNRGRAGAEVTTRMGAPQPSRKDNQGDVIQGQSLLPARQGPERSLLIVLARVAHA